MNRNPIELRGIRMAKKKENTVVCCDFDGGLRMPKVCVSCGSDADEKRHEFIASNFLKTSKVKINFPVCDICYEADQKYVNAIPVTIIGSIAFIFSVFSLFNRPEKIPSGIFLAGGIIWLTVIAGYVIWTNIRAHQQNSQETILRRANLKKAITVSKFALPHRSAMGQIIFVFRNARFAKAFKNLNKGQILKK